MFSNKRLKATTDDSYGEVEKKTDGDAFDIAFNTFGSRNYDTRVPAAQAAPSGRGTPPETDEFKERQTKAMASLRKGHNAWDRTSREWDGLVSKSAAHKNTKGCKFEVDLKNLTVKRRDLDDKLKSIERKYLTDPKSLDEDAMKWVSQYTHDLKETITQGQKKASALKPWFGID